MTVTESWLMQEYKARARQANLEVDCLGSGNPNSKIVIIGEAPGERESMMKMPMVGTSGRILWNALKSHDIVRGDCYTTNVVKRQLVLTGKDKEKRSVKGPELEHWHGLLDWEIDQLPNVEYILCLGNMAIEAVFGQRGITNWRGSVVDCLVGRSRRPVKVFCAFNPAHLLHEPRWSPIFKFDIDKFRRLLDGKYRPHVIRPTINPSPTEAIQYIDRLFEEAQPIAYDIETMGNETACVGFANDPHEGICINFRDQRSNRYTPAEERLVRCAIQQFFRRDGLQFIAQSGNFDRYWLGYKDRIDAPIWFDTLLAHHTLYPRLPHNLGFLTAQCTEHPYYKDERLSWREGGDIDQFWEYNVKDCCITHTVHTSLLKELKAQGLDTFFFDHVMRLTPHLASMTVGGVLCDVSLKDEVDEGLTQDVERELADFHNAVVDCTGDLEYFPNPNSNKDLPGLLLDRLKLVGRGRSCNAANRQRMQSHPGTSEKSAEVLRTCNKYKKDHKFLTTYAESRVDEDNRIRCEYKQFGVEEAPGRLSSTQTMWHSGMNLQNQPIRSYPMFIADPSYMLTYFDLKQAEAKIVAWQWNIPALKENFIRAETEEGFDVHRGNAARIFRGDYDDIPSEDYDESGERTKRYLGKRCVHGLNYRMMPNKLAEVCDIPLWQAIEAHAAYHRAFPEIQLAWKRIIAEVKETKMLFTPLGRRLFFLEAITEDCLDSVVAFVPQSTIGDFVGSIIYKCHEDRDWPRGRARILLNIHDALICLHELDSDVMGTVSAIMKKHAEEPIVIRGEPITIYTDFKHSVPDDKGVHRWSTLK